MDETGTEAPLPLPGSNNALPGKDLSGQHKSSSETGRGLAEVRENKATSDLQRAISGIEAASPSSYQLPWKTRRSGDSEYQSQILHVIDGSSERLVMSW